MYNGLSRDLRWFDLVKSHGFFDKTLVFIFLEVSYCSFLPACLNSARLDEVGLQGSFHRLFEVVTVLIKPVQDVSTLKHVPLRYHHLCFSQYLLIDSLYFTGYIIFLLPTKSTGHTFFLTAPYAAAVPYFPHVLFHFVLLLLYVDLHIEILDANSHTRTLEARVLQSELFKLLGDDLVGLLQYFHEHARFLSFMLGYEGICNTLFVACSPGTPDSVDVVLFVFGAIIVDDCLNGRYVQPTTGHISGYQDVGVTGFELCQD